ncbi:unnamed protein product [Camellia sinensis]
MEQVKHGKFTQIHKKKKVMRLAMLLIEVFERTGNSIEEYLQLQQLDVCINTCSILFCFATSRISIHDSRFHK